MEKIKKPEKIELPYIAMTDKEELWNQALTESDAYYAQVLEGLKESWKLYGKSYKGYENYSGQYINDTYNAMKSIATSLGWDKEE